MLILHSLPVPENEKVHVLSLEAPIYVFVKVFSWRKLLRLRRKLWFQLSMFARGTDNWEVVDACFSNYSLNNTHFNIKRQGLIRLTFWTLKQLTRDAIEDTLRLERISVANELRCRDSLNNPNNWWNLLLFILSFGLLCKICFLIAVPEQKE